MNISKVERRYLEIMLVAALVAYALPWVSNPGVSLTMGGYDLAEWVSLHPAVRGDGLLFTSLMLRLPLVCLTLMAAFGGEASIGWLQIGIVFGLVVAMLPPFEFFAGAGGDVNYRQQFVLAVTAALGAIVGLSGVAKRYRHWIVIALMLVGAVGSTVGMAQGYSLLRGFQLPTHIGIGSAALTSLFIVGLLLVGREARNKQGSTF